MKTHKITVTDIEELLGGTPPEFPKYVTQLLNLANQNAQGTRPRVVGQMSDLIQQFPGKNLTAGLAIHPSRLNLIHMTSSVILKSNLRGC